MNMCVDDSWKPWRAYVAHLLLDGLGVTEHRRADEQQKCQRDEASNRTTPNHNLEHQPPHRL